MELFEKPKIFCLIFIAFLESKLNFESLEKINQPHSLRISEVIDSERRADLNISKALLLKTLRHCIC